jgi:hypothetical protein
MTLEPIGVFTLALGIVALLFKPRLTIWALIPATLLGSAGALLLTGSGTIQPAHFLLGFAVPAILFRRGATAVIFRSASFPNEGFWLTALVAFAVVGAMFVPSLLAGATQINAIGFSDYGVSLRLVPLGPTSGNITQSIYLLADLACFFVVLAFAQREGGVAILRTTLIAYGLANIGFALLDLATFWTQTGYLLDFMRNAQYALHFEESSSNMKRIVGSFTEASSFSYATIGSLCFTARLCLSGIKPRLTLFSSLASLLLLVLSTSSTALVAAPVMMGYIYGATAIKASRGKGSGGKASGVETSFVALGPLLGIAAASAVALHPATSDAIRDYLNATIFEKATTDSGISRAAWNTAAINNFFDTWGIGGGLGSIRASSFALALLSNLGVAGVVLALPFFYQTLYARRFNASPEIAATRAAARTACLGLLFAACVSGSLVDLGLPFFIFAATACAEPRTARPVDQMAAAAQPSRAFVPVGRAAELKARRPALI